MITVLIAIISYLELKMIKKFIGLNATIAHLY